MAESCISKMPNFFYLILCWLVYLISLPILLLIPFRQKHKTSIPARFFTPLALFSKHRFCADFKPTLWFHACSFGEVKSLEPVLKNISNECILISVITQTGFILAKRTYANNKNIRIHYLPFEIFLPLYKKCFSALKTLVVVEAELWFEIFYIAKKVGAKTILLNARISSKSYPKYKKFGFFYRTIFGRIDMVFAQTQADKEHLVTLGAQNVQVFGNLKTLSIPTITTSYPKPKKLTIIGASTHNTEEELILKAFLELKKTQDCILFLAPRHPERFKIVVDSLKNAKINFDSLTNGFRDDVDVLLIDKLMELNNFYAISDITILGGSFIKAGGHNPLEPVFFKNKLISGEHIFNQTALFESIIGYVLSTKENLATILLNHASIPQATIKPININLQELIAQITKI